METAEEKLKALKEQIESDKQKIFNVLFIDNPTQLLIQPPMALQLVMALRSTITLLKKLDENYEFKIDEIPGYTNGIPNYIR